MISLLRHGLTTAPGRYIGWNDVPLSIGGRRQMETSIGQQRWDRILSSTLQRCAEPAQDWARAWGVPCVLDERLRELDFGDWDGLTAAQLQQRDPETLGRFWRDPVRYPPPGGETLQALQQRVCACLQEHWPTRGERMLVVSHGGAIRALIAARDGLEPAQWLGIEVPLAALIHWNEPMEPPCSRC